MYFSIIVVMFISEAIVQETVQDYCYHVQWRRDFRMSFKACKCKIRCTGRRLSADTVTRCDSCQIFPLNFPVVFQLFYLFIQQLKIMFYMDSYLSLLLQFITLVWIIFWWLCLNVYPVLLDGNGKRLSIQIALRNKCKWFEQINGVKAYWTVVWCFIQNCRNEALTFWCSCMLWLWFKISSCKQIVLLFIIELGMASC